MSKRTCDNCNEGKIGRDPGSSVPATCNVCCGSGWMPQDMANRVAAYEKANELPSPADIFYRDCGSGGRLT